MGGAGPTRKIERVQTGIRFEKRMLKVLKGLAEYLDLTLGDLMEGIVLHSFEGKPPFSRNTIKRIGQLKDFYGLDLSAEDSHKLTEWMRLHRARTRLEVALAQGFSHDGRGVLVCQPRPPRGLIRA